MTIGNIDDKQKKGDNTMTKKEKKEEILTTAEMYKELDEKDKIFINGYITGKREERAKWERKPA